MWTHFTLQVVVNINIFCSQHELFTVNRNSLVMMNTFSSQDERLLQVYKLYNVQSTQYFLEWMWTFSAVNIHNFVVNMPTFSAVMGFEQLHTLHKKCSFTLYLQTLIIYGISSCKSLGYLQRLAVYAHISTCMYPTACTSTITTSRIIA